MRRKWIIDKDVVVMQLGLYLHHRLLLSVTAVHIPSPLSSFPTQKAANMWQILTLMLMGAQVAECHTSFREGFVEKWRWMSEQ